MVLVFVFFFFKQKTAYEMRISDWSSDVCSSDLSGGLPRFRMRGNGQAEAAETRFAVANGHRIAYRSVGDEGPHGVPIVFLNRFRGSMEIGRASCRERVCQYV